MSLTVQETITKLRSDAGYARLGDDEAFYLFREYNTDGSLKSPGIKFIQSVHAPVDGVLIHPDVTMQLFNSTAFNGVIDIVRAK